MKERNPWAKEDEDGRILPDILVTKFFRNAYRTQCCIKLKLFIVIATIIAFAANA